MRNRSTPLTFLQKSLWVIGLWIVLFPAGSWAHGSFPTVEGVSESFSDSMVIRSTFGIWIGHPDTGFYLLCEEAYEGLTAVPAVETKAGTILVGLYKGVSIMDTDLGTVEKHPLGDTEYFVRDLAQLSNGDLFATTSSGGKENGVFKSEDAGITWDRETLPLQDHYFTSIKRLADDSLVALGFQLIEPMASACIRSPGGVWDCGSFPPVLDESAEQPFLDDCMAGKGCLYHWLGATENETLRFSWETWESSLVRSNGPAEPGSSSHYVGAIFVPNSESILVATKNGLVRQSDPGAEWESLPAPIFQCLTRTKDGVYACANPFLPKSFAVGLFSAADETWIPLIPNFEVLLGIFPSNDDSFIATQCSEPWSSLTNTLGIEETKDETQEDEDASAEGEPSMIEPEFLSPNPTNGGCAVSYSHSRLFGVLFLLLGLSRSRSLLCLICALAMTGLACEEASESEISISPADASPEETEDTRAGEEPDTTGDTDAEEIQKEPIAGAILLGEFQQAGNNISEENAFGVIANVVFALADEMEPAFDETIEDCRFRTVAADTEIKEPVGLDGGSVTLDGFGIDAPLHYLPFDFGEALGGYAYDHDLPEDIVSIFVDGESINVQVSGTDEMPSFEGQVPVPGKTPELTPPAGPPTPLEDGSLRYTWEPDGSTEVIFEWDAFLGDGGAVQLRCYFDDAAGEGVIPPAFAEPFIGELFSMSISRATRKKWSDEHVEVEVVFTRRKVTFVSPF